MVALDIGVQQPKPQQNPVGTLMKMWYQLTLATAFVIGGPIGLVMTRFVSTLFRAPSYGNLIIPRVNYLYFHTWLEIFSGSLSVIR